MAITPMTSTWSVARTTTATSDQDWAALQAIPDSIPLLDARGFPRVQVVVVARGDVGQVVTGTTTIQMVEVVDVSGKSVIVGAAEDAGVPYGAGLTLDLAGARQIAFRISSPTGSPVTITIYARGVQ